MGMFDDILGVAGLALKAYDTFGNQQEVPESTRRVSERATQIQDALLNPAGSPLFQQLQGQEEERIMGDFTKALNQASVQNNRRVARGGGMGFVQPERRDESIYYALSRFPTEAQRQARDQARSYLSAALGASQPMMAAGTAQMGVDTANRRNTNDFLAGAVGFGRGLLDGGGAPGSGGQDYSAARFWPARTGGSDQAIVSTSGN